MDNRPDAVILDVIRQRTMKRKSQISLLAAFLILLAFAGGLATRDFFAKEAPIGPGDTINIAFTANRIQYRKVVVTQNNSINLPLLGTRCTVGKTAIELENELLFEYSQLMKIQDLDIFLRRKSVATN